MATQFQTFEKNLVKDYIKQGKTPTSTRALEKKKDHWDAFVAYKCFELGTQWVQRNKENASKKSPHSRARWLQGCNPEMGEDGARFAC
jgi:hypothetical protein